MLEVSRSVSIAQTASRGRPIQQRTRRRVDGDNDAAERRKTLRPAPSRLERGAVPQRARHVFDELGLELLPAEPRAFILPHDLRHEGRGEVARIFSLIV